MEFSYIAVDYSGKKQKGLLEANNDREVLNYLRASHFTPIAIKKHADNNLHLPFVEKVRSSDLVVFTRQLSSMIVTGLTLLEALNILHQETPNKTFQVVIEDIIQNVSEGHSFSQALSNHKDIFNDVYISLVQAAENGGLLDKMLLRLANNLEKEDDLKKRIKGALFYPMIILIGVFGVIVIMNIFVIPQLGKLYESLNLHLPVTTKIILSLSKLSTTFYPILFIFGIGGFFSYKRFTKTDLGRRTIDKVKLNLPVLGQLYRMSLLDEVTRTLSLLIGAGASILEALSLTKNVSNNIWYKDAIANASTLVEKGVNLSDALAQQNIFPSILIQMARVGEATGRMDGTLEKVAQYYERDIDVRVKALTTSLEPILILVLGVAVGFLIISVITPIYSLISQIQ